MGGILRLIPGEIPGTISIEITESVMAEILSIILRKFAGKTIRNSWRNLKEITERIPEEALTNNL